MCRALQGIVENPLASVDLVNTMGVKWIPDTEDFLEELGHLGVPSQMRRLPREVRCRGWGGLGRAGAVGREACEGRWCCCAMPAGVGAGRGSWVRLRLQGVRAPAGAPCHCIALSAPRPAACTPACAATALAAACVPLQVVIDLENDLVSAELKDQLLGADFQAQRLQAAEAIAPDNTYTG